MMCRNLIAAAVMLAGASVSIAEDLVCVSNPDPNVLPTLSVREDQGYVLVGAKFPNVPEFTCECWCYECEVDFKSAEPISFGGIKTIHNWRKDPNILVITEFKPQAGAVDICARLESKKGKLNVSPEKLGLNICWQLKRTPAFASAPDDYPSFVKRCFIYTKSGRTFLDKTVRNKIPCREPNDRYNNPPWVQMYAAEGQGIPEVGATSWASYSSDRYTVPIIGAVSRDTKYLAAIANGSTNNLCQAWHDCMHNNPIWLPENAAPQDRRWHLKIYAMENNPEALLKRISSDFPKSPTMITDNLPPFYKTLADRLTFPMSWLSGNYKDFSEWKKIARKQVFSCLFNKPPDAPFDPDVIALEDRGSYTAKKIMLNITEDSRIAAYILEPKGKGPFPGILVMHDHGAKFDIGKEKVIRPIGDPERFDSAQKWTDQLYGGRFIGDELAKRGYVCFSADLLNWGERGGAGFDGQQALASSLMHLGYTLSGLNAYEDLRAAEFLSSRPNVDSNRIGAVGLSMGSYRTWQICALSDRVKAGVAVCFMTQVKEQIVPKNNQTRGQSSFAMLHPGLFNYMDWPDYASLACPKPMLFYCGSRDSLFSLASEKNAFAILHAVWKSQGVEDRLVTKIWDVEHVFNKQMQEAAFDWLDKQLKK